MDPQEWQGILAKLAEPFDPKIVEWKPQTFSRDRSRVLAVAYVDTQSYQKRLDEVLPDWSDDYAIWFSDPQETLAKGGELRKTPGKVFVKCRITLDGVTRSDVGECELIDENALTSAKAQSFKRTCSAFGLGRYLYDVEKEWVNWNADKSEFTPDAIKNLEAALTRRTASAQPAASSQPRPAEPKPTTTIIDPATVMCAVHNAPMYAIKKGEETIYVHKVLTPEGKDGYCNGTEIRLAQAGNNTTKQPAPAAPQQPDPDSQVPERYCAKHGVALREYTSKKTGKPFWAHKVEGDGSLCFGDDD